MAVGACEHRHFHALYSRDRPRIDTVGELIFQARREMTSSLKASRHLPIRQRHLFWAYFLQEPCPRDCYFVAYVLSLQYRKYFRYANFGKLQAIVKGRCKPLPTVMITKS